MRDIKFRAWDRVDSHMLSWNFMMQSAFNDKDSSLLYQIFRTSTLHNDNIHLMQYTGLHDINDKEIYEGDIVQFEWMKDVEQGEIIFSDGCFKVSKLQTYRDVPLLIEYPVIKVIGNVYENPELIQS